MASTPKSLGTLPREMTSMEELLITGNVHGHIKMHDSEGRLRLLYSSNGKGVWLIIALTEDSKLEYQISSDLMIEGKIPNNMMSTITSKR